MPRGGIAIGHDGIEPDIFKRTAHIDITEQQTEWEKTLFLQWKRYRTRTERTRPAPSTLYALYLLECFSLRTLFQLPICTAISPANSGKPPRKPKQREMQNNEHLAPSTSKIDLDLRKRLLPILDFNKRLRRRPTHCFNSRCMIRWSQCRRSRRKCGFSFQCFDRFLGLKPVRMRSTRDGLRSGAGMTARPGPVWEMIVR